MRPSNELALARSHVVANSGSTQFALMIREGLSANHRVVEYGCGMLDLARWLVPFLLPGHYTGVDPNGWVSEATLAADPDFARVCGERLVARHGNDDFVVGGEADFVFAHSVLSHASTVQLEQFLRRSPLAPGGMVLASLRLGDEDSNDTEWVYPGVSYFTRDTVETKARDAGLRTHWRPEYRTLMVQEHPSEYHDWVAFTRFGAWRGFHCWVCERPCDHRCGTVAAHCCIDCRERER